MFISTTKYKQIQICKFQKLRKSRCVESHTRRLLVLVHDGYFDSFDFSYMGGFLDDAAGGASRSTVFRLGQVGQGHGCVDLSPVRVIFPTSFFLRHAAAEDTHVYIQTSVRHWNTSYDVAYYSSYLQGNY